MKRTAAFAALTTFVLALLPAKELALKNAASIDIKTKTSWGINLDNPDQNGLALDYLNLAIILDQINGGTITNKLKTDMPVGFMTLDLSQIETRWTTYSDAGGSTDNNNPGGTTNILPGWNSSATGYWSPIYIENFISGIAWKNWTLQLAAGGDSANNWRPWARNNGSYARSEFIQRWAYMDTRIQYRRQNIPHYLRYLSEDPTIIPDQTMYWTDGTKDTNIALNPTGTMVGLCFDGTDFSGMLKYMTENEWTKARTDSDPKNGNAAGLDFAFEPTYLKGFRVFGSAGILFNYGDDDSEQPWALGGKVCYNIPLFGSYSVEPYVGYQQICYYENADDPDAREYSAGVTIHWDGNGGWQYDAMAERDGVLFPGLTIAYTLLDSDTSSNSDTMDSNVKITLFEESDNYGVVPGLGAELCTEMLGLNDFVTSQILLSMYLDYTVYGIGNGILIPWTRILYDNLGQGEDAGRVNNFKIDAGLRCDKYIKNAAFGVTYESKNLTARNHDETNLTYGYYGLGFLQAWVEIKL